jgi:hypothetical protein
VREGIVRPPNLGEALVRVDDPVEWHALLLVQPPLGEPVGADRGGRQDFGGEQHGAKGEPVQPAGLLQRHHEEVG